MPIVVNSNASASSASLNLSNVNHSSERAFERLSSGKRSTMPVMMQAEWPWLTSSTPGSKEQTQLFRTLKNALSFLQVQDGAMETVGKVVNRMSELRVMAQDRYEKLL